MEQKIKIADSNKDILRCFELMQALRTHLVKDHFVSTVRAMQRDGYHLVYIEQERDIVALAGYRIYTNLFMGKNLYIDDLVTCESHRSSGLGKRLIDYLRTTAKSEGCKVLHLDSGTHRGRAHKFYFNQGMTIASYHFSESL